MKDYYKIKKCFDCPNRVVDLDSLENKLRGVIGQLNYNSLISSRINPDRSLHHQLFHIALAGCPNSCSQPQIKDFGVQGQACPEAGEGCNQCGLCVEACPEESITMNDDGVIIDRDKCLNCGLCARACPTGAMTISHNGFKVLAGGKLGRHPRLASELCALGDEDDVARILKQCIRLYLNEGRPGERFGSILARAGLNGIKLSPSDLPG